MFSCSVGPDLIVSLAVQERLVSQSPVCQLLVLSPEQLEFFFFFQKMFAMITS